jgi:hypothetical protein
MAPTLWNDTRVMESMEGKLMYPEQVENREGCLYGIP